LGAIAWAYLGLISVDEHIERRRIDIAFLREHGLQSADAQLEGAQAAVLMLLAVGMIMPVLVLVIVIGSGHTPMLGQAAAQS
jgi:hypothetical protein